MPVGIVVVEGVGDGVVRELLVRRSFQLALPALQWGRGCNCGRRAVEQLVAVACRMDGLACPTWLRLQQVFHRGVAQSVAPEDAVV